MDSIHVCRTFLPSQTRPPEHQLQCLSFACEGPLEAFCWQHEMKRWQLCYLTCLHFAKHLCAHLTPDNRIELLAREGLFFLTQRCSWPLNLLHNCLCTVRA